MKWILLVSICISLCACDAAADTIIMDGADVSARVVKFDRNKVVFKRGCKGGEEETTTWERIGAIRFADRCGKEDATPLALDPPTCELSKVDEFIVQFKGRQPFVPEGVALTADNVVHMDLHDPWEQAHGNRSAVAMVRKGKVCREDPRRMSDPFPKSFCHEPRQVAVAFDYNTPLSNKILTNGFSFVVRTSGKPRKGFDVDAFGKELRSAFGRAIGLWVAALSTHKESMTPTIQAFIDSRTSKSKSGYRLETPPQVIQLSCPQTATFVIELTFARRKLFPDYPVALARSRVQGRTIALNVRKFNFRTEVEFKDNGRLRFELDDGAINLLPILTHELGHAFGLTHADVEDQPALMDSLLSRDALAPTAQDTAAFAKILDTSIQGAKPGVIEMVPSAGVRPPRDFVVKKLH